MNRILLDTNVYGELIEDLELVDRIAKIVPAEVVIYGIRIIRDELRDVPKNARLGNRNKRLILLNLYDSLVRKDHHSLEYNKLVDTLAKDYFIEYRKNKGNLSNKEMRNDLIIIATATIYQLDVIISNDERSMFSSAAIKAYNAVNKRYGIRNPIFKKYKTFRSEVMKTYHYGT